MFSITRSLHVRILMTGLVILVMGTDSKKVQAEGEIGLAETASNLVQEALHRELYGLQQERDELLAEALKLDPQNALGNWHHGRVLVGPNWIDAEQMSTQRPETSAWREYLRRRESLNDNVNDHWQLASFCRDNELPQQERAHLSRVLDLDPDHAAARDRLGFRRVGSEWRTEAELNADVIRRANEAKAAGEWRSTLVAIRNDLLGSDPRRKSAARERLTDIQSVHAIPLMESLLSLSGEVGALAVVQYVSGMHEAEATASLIRHAVLAESPKVREQAAEQLSYRPMEAYVPLMLAGMYTPVTSQFGVAPLRNGRLGYRHMFLREGQEERQLLVLDTEYRRQRRLGGNGAETLFRAFSDSVEGIVERERAVAQQNLMQLTLNRRISDALNTATQQDLSADPFAWWRWWDEENDMVRTGEKQVRTRGDSRQVRVVDRSMFSTALESTANTSPQTPRAECFVAGTDVLTIAGMQPIESLRVGDLVLAQDIESGELAFKPVLRTTVRPAGELVKLHIGRDTLESSSGHLFWVAGHGWAKSRHLESGMQLHALHGSLPVSLVEKGRNAETYNLVVADFNTYFVGQERILSHDVTSRRATNRTLPGVKAATR